MTANTKHQTGDLLQPSDMGIKIWRYMDLTKLVAFLETGSLYFARVDTFGDPYEGSWTRLNKADQEQLSQQIIADLERERPDAKWKPTLKELRQNFENFTHFWRQTTYINCWHGGETESAAMWNLYGTTAGSIVIQSTYKKLMDALPDRVYRDDVHMGKVYMGMVQYKDYNSSEDSIPSGNMMYPFLHKRKEFEYEKEVRALIWNTRVLGKGDDKPRGITVDIDTDKIVETIRVQPTTPAWVRESIEKLIKKYDWGVKVRQSQIDIEPMY